MQIATSEYARDMQELLDFLHHLKHKWTLSVELPPRIVTVDISRCPNLIAMLQETEHEAHVPNGESGAGSLEEGEPLAVVRKLARVHAGELDT